MMPMPRVYISIINWNGWKDTIECLESIFAGRYTNFAVLLCDNGSTDNSLLHLRAWAENKKIGYTELIGGKCSQLSKVGTVGFRLVLIDNRENLGFAGGNNVALKYALGCEDLDYVWLLNNDTLVHPDALAKMVERMQQEPEAGMCGSTLLHYANREKVQALGGGYYCKWIGLPWHLGRLTKVTDPINQSKVEARMNYVVGASMLVSRRFLAEIGFLCEEYFLFFEETDWAIRAKGRYSLAYAAESIVYHKVGASIGTSSNPHKKSFICDYFSIRNRLFFTWKFYPYALPTVYLMLLLTLAGRVLMGKWDRARMILQLFVDFNSQYFLPLNKEP